MIAKRMLDVLVSLITLIAGIPLFLFVAIWIKIDSPGPIFFSQTRVGRYGKLFRIHKFRSMAVGAESVGPLITADRDERVTRCGHFLRRTKLDELPQMFDVLVGNMSLVGARPEVPKYVVLYPDDIREEILSLRPGITGYAALAYRRESELLSQSVDPEKMYTDEVLPAKLKYYCEYVRQRTLWIDISIIFRTLMAVCGSDDDVRSAQYENESLTDTKRETMGTQLR
ncbi:sugar transferase [Telmatobacter sp. DSM 110680]|uniref:Sugar transferase n=1 Tax=Telmatobacter sp. DSM 110680 TaxID=3036704 RepID=A0AAU7DJA9_9BACT